MEWHKTLGETCFLEIVTPSNDREENACGPQKNRRDLENELGCRRNEISNCFQSHASRFVHSVGWTPI